VSNLQVEMDPSIASNGKPEDDRIKRCEIAIERLCGMLAGFTVERGGSKRPLFGTELELIRQYIRRDF
jgi:hypothetical protein